MTGRRGRPKTTGKSLNKRANTCTSARTNTETSMSVLKKTKSAIPLTNFLKPTNSAMNKSVNNPLNSPTDSRVNSPVNNLHGDHIAADESKNNEENIEFNEEHSDSNLSFSDTNSSSESELSVKDVEIADSAEPNDSESELPREIQKYDGRKDNLSFTEKWEKKYTWSCYSCLKGGWFCKTFEEYSDPHDEYWKTLPRKHDEHLGMFLNEHANSDKHKKALRNKQELKIMLFKGNVVRQLMKGMETKTEKDRRKNRILIKKFLKTVYFMAKQKWAVKNDLEDMINFLSDIGVEDIKLHIENKLQK